MALAIGMICPGAASAVDLTKWHLIFSDEFNGTSLDWTKWGVGESWFGNNSGDASACSNQSDYCNYKANISESNGFLCLRGDNLTNGLYPTGGIHTLQQFGYGYYESRFGYRQARGCGRLSGCLAAWAIPKLT